MEFEAGESIISPEMFAAYGYGADESPSTLHKNRVKDKDGNWQGFYSDKKFSQNFMVLFHLNRDEKQFDFELIPIDLQLNSPLVTKRGLPVLAGEEEKVSLAHRLNQISNGRYNTEIILEDNRLKLKIHS